MEERMARYRKFVAAVLGAVVMAIAGFWTDGQITASEWINVAIGGVAAAQVYIAANLAGDPMARYTKSIIAGLAAGLALLTSLITSGISAQEWLQVGIAVATAAGVFTLPNDPELTGTLADGAHFAGDIAI